MRRINYIVLALLLFVVATSTSYSQTSPRVFGAGEIRVDDGNGNGVYLSSKTGTLGVNEDGNVIPGAQTFPSNCALLDLSSTTKGFLPPRMTTAQELLICGGTPNEGLIVYNTTTHSLDVYNGSSWSPIGGWSLSGNTVPVAGGTAPNQSFIGTLNGMDFVVATNVGLPGSGVGERIRVTAGGYVGVRDPLDAAPTFTAQTTLHVDGTPATLIGNAIPNVRMNSLAGVPQQTPAINLANDGIVMGGVLGDLTKYDVATVVGSVAWLRTGNTIADGNNLLGTLNDIAVDIRTNNTTRVTIGNSVDPNAMTVTGNELVNGNEQVNGTLSNTGNATLGTNAATTNSLGNAGASTNNIGNGAGATNSIGNGGGATNNTFGNGAATNNIGNNAGSNNVGNGATVANSFGNESPSNTFGGVRAVNQTNDYGSSISTGNVINNFGFRNAGGTINNNFGTTGATVNSIGSATSTNTMTGATNGIVGGTNTITGVTNINTTANNTTTIGNSGAVASNTVINVGTGGGNLTLNNIANDNTTVSLLTTTGVGTPASGNVRYRSLGSLITGSNGVDVTFDGTTFDAHLAPNNSTVLFANNRFINTNASTLAITSGNPGTNNLLTAGGTAVTINNGVAGTTDIGNVAGSTNNMGNNATLNVFGNGATQNNIGNSATLNLFGQIAGTNRFGQGAGANEFGLASASNTMGTNGTSTNAIRGTTNINTAAADNTNINTFAGAGTVTIGGTTHTGAISLAANTASAITLDVAALANNLVLNNIQNDNTTTQILTLTGLTNSGNVRLHSLSTLITGSQGVEVTYAGGTADAHFASTNISVPFSSTRFINLAGNTLNVTTNGGANNMVVLNGSGAGASTTMTVAPFSGATTGVFVSGTSALTSGVNVNMSSAPVTTSGSSAFNGVIQGSGAGVNVVGGSLQGFANGGATAYGLSAYGQTTGAGGAAIGVVGSSQAFFSTGTATGGDFAATGNITSGIIKGVNATANANNAGTGVGGDFSSNGATGNNIGVRSTASGAGAIAFQATGAATSLQTDNNNILGDGAGNDNTTVNISGTGNMTLNGIAQDNTTVSLLTTTGTGTPANGNVRYRQLGSLITGSNGVDVTWDGTTFDAHFAPNNSTVLFVNDRFINTDASTLHITSGGPAGTDFATFAGTTIGLNNTAVGTNNIGFTGGTNTIAGTTTINNNVNNATSINTGTSNAAVTIGADNVGSTTGIQSRTTSIGTNSASQAVNIGNTGTVTVLGAPVNVNNSGAGITNINRAGTGQTNIGNTTGGTTISGQINLLANTPIHDGTSTGTSNQVLHSNGAGTPTWITLATDNATLITSNGIGTPFAIDLTHANTWTGSQTFGSGGATTTTINAGTANFNVANIANDNTTTSLMTITGGAGTGSVRYRDLGSILTGSQGVEVALVAGTLDAHFASTNVLSPFSSTRFINLAGNVLNFTTNGGANNMVVLDGSGAAASTAMSVAPFSGATTGVFVSGSAALTSGVNVNMTSNPVTTSGSSAVNATITGSGAGVNVTGGTYQGFATGGAIGWGLNGYGQTTGGGGSAIGVVGGAQAFFSTGTATGGDFSATGNITSGTIKGVNATANANNAPLGIGGDFSSNGALTNNIGVRASASGAGAIAIQATGAATSLVTDNNNTLGDGAGNDNTTINISGTGNLTLNGIASDNTPTNILVSTGAPNGNVRIRSLASLINADQGTQLTVIAGVPTVLLGGSTNATNPLTSTRYVNLTNQVLNFTNAGGANNLVQMDGNAGSVAVNGTLSSTGNTTLGTNAGTTNSFGTGGTATINNIGTNGAGGTTTTNLGNATAGGSTTIVNIGQPVAGAFATTNIGDIAGGGSAINVLGVTSINTSFGATTTIGNTGAGGNVSVNSAGTIALNGTTNINTGAYALTTVGDGATANQQLRVNGVVDAAVGNTLAGNPTVWDMVVQGDQVTTGIAKFGGSIWIDGNSATHAIRSENALHISTAAGNLTLSAQSAQIRTDGSVIPNATNTYSLGTGALRWGSMFGNLLDVTTSVNAGSTITAGTDITSTTGNISATVGNITAPGGVMTANGDITTSTGNFVATAGGVTAQTGITSNTGNITATAGTVTAGTGFIANAGGANLTGRLTLNGASSPLRTGGIDGNLGDLLVSAGVGNSPTWLSPAAAGLLTACGGATVNTIAMFTGATTICNSPLTTVGTAVTGSGSITATSTLTAGTGITSTTGNIVATAGNINATAGQVNAGSSMSAGTSITAGGLITTTGGNITAPAGTITSQGTITSTAGNLVSTAGSVTAQTSITANTGNIIATAGNIAATAGSVSAGTTVTAGTDITSTGGNINATAGALRTNGVDRISNNGTVIATAVRGSFVSSAAAPYATVATDYFVKLTAGSTGAALPASVAGNIGRIIVVRNVSGGAVSITAGGSSIDGAAPVAGNLGNGVTRTFVSDGAGDWVSY